MREVAFILLFFLIVQLLGLYVGANLVLQETEFQTYNVGQIGGGSESAYNSFFFVAAVLGGAVLLIILLKFYRGTLLFKILEFLVVFVASQIVFEVVLINLGFDYSFLLAFACAFCLAAAKFFVPKLKNVTAIVSSAGVGAIFGFSLYILPAIIFIILLSVYDVLSVFWTKHMVLMAKEFSKRQLSFSVSVEKEYKVKIPRKKKPVIQKSMLELGTGDMSIPLMLAVSAFRWGCSNAAGSCVLSLAGLVDAFAVIIGSSLALYVVLWYVLTRKAFLPALPPLALGGLIGLAIAKLLGF